MFTKLIFVSILSVVFCEKYCYFNAPCSYDMFSSKTPYDSIRGDIRDADNLPGCQVVGLWSLQRHGNRNPGTSATANMKTLYDILVEDIRRQYENNNLVHCIQDIEDCLSTTWNSTLETSTSDLTGIGYEELFDIGKRIRQAFPDILSFSNDSFYFRPTDEQRTITSAIAFVHGLTDSTHLDLDNNIDTPWEQDDVIRPYETCEEYQEDVKNGPTLADQLAAYDSSSELLAVRDRVQERLNIDYQLSATDVYTLYEYCRFHRSWSPQLRDPWCAFFTEEDLVVLEYRDDVRHYYRNGYGSPVNINLGAAALKDLYEHFEAITSTGRERIVSYFTHNTMFEMFISALGLYKDRNPPQGSSRDPNRIWRTSEIAAFATNFIAVLHRCNESDVQNHRVQIFINEKPTICPEDGCSWEEFVIRFQTYSNNTISYCSSEIYDFHSINSSNSNLVSKIVFVISLLLLFRF